MRITKPLLWLFTLLWFVLGIWWYSSSNCTSCAAEVPPVKNSIVSNLPGFSVSDGAWNLSTTDNLKFGKSGVIPILGSNMITLMDSLGAYGKANDTKRISVIGYYNSSETNTSTFENLGMARANELKKVLMSKGFESYNISTESKMNDSLVYFPADTLVGGISMSFLPPLKEDLFAPRTVYFNTGKNTLNVDADLEVYLNQANQYLKTHTDKTLMVTGHTDNVGDPVKNVALSAARAVFVESELSKKGIAASSISTEGKGMAEPIADNNTADGKAKNRRVTIQLK
jgi:OmpA-OmpF porin, OOP family